MSESSDIRFRGSVRQRGAVLHSRGPVAVFEIRGDRISVGERLPGPLAKLRWPLVLLWATEVGDSIAAGARVVRLRGRKLGIEHTAYALRYADGRTSTLEFLPLNIASFEHELTARGLLGDAG